MSGQASVRARSNIALVKYWGKADPVLNTPAVGSISITLDRLWTETTVRFDASLERDSLVLDGAERAEQLDRVSRCVDLIRDIAGTDIRAEIVSANNFPTGAGLASSASGFAALVGAAAEALGLELSPRELSILARRGSGSAARSIFGGYVEMHKGEAVDGSDSFAEPLAAAEAWPLTVLVAITEKKEKAVGSGSGMSLSATSSPYYAAWVDSHPADLDTARRAIVERDFATLATVSESSCLKMHAAAISTTPPLVYWNGATVDCLNRVRAARNDGVPVFFTIDAGPQVKAVCLPAAADDVRALLERAPGVENVIETGLGPGLEAF
ncbi:MAG: diphosphomevalonate decarboxylase [Gammaproteobacteria bacterium]|nr:diphosphomevalonate decarboxylase [Gammaproteobacteria bacterium]